MNNVKLELTNHGYLDISREIPLALNFNLNDVRDISNRGGVWSKTIKLPGTANNNDILGNIFNVNINTLTFSPIIKEPCRIIIDGLSVFEGVFQVRKINKNFKNSQDFKVEYICFIKSDTSSFYESISGEYLTDIDLSQFNHNWSISNLEDSMNSGIWTDGYQYFLSYNNNSDLDYAEQDLIPAIYAKIYWDAIFDRAGYTYEWGEIGVLNFDRMIIPYNGGKFRGSVDQQFKFSAGISTGSDYWLLSTNSAANPNVSGSTGFYTNNSGGVSNGRAPVIFDDDTTSPWNDPNTLYSTTTGEYNVLQYNGNIEFNTKYTVSMQLLMKTFTGAPSSNNISAQSGYAQLRVRNTVRVYDINNNQLGILSEQFSDPLSFDGNDMSTLYSTNFNVEAGTFDINHNAIFASTSYPTAASVKNIVEFVPLINSPSTWLGFKDGAFRYQADIFAFFYPQGDADGHFNNSPETAIVNGSPMNANDLIPRKVLQSDFILSIIKMFNLYIKEDKTNPNNLIVKTRDKFYDDGVDIDWTSKIDITSVDVEILSNTQKKRKVFSYKDDTKDVIATAYKDQTKETYGQLEYVFENEFIKSIDKVQPIFSPSLIVNGYKRGTSLLVPFINAREPKSNIRILYAGDVLSATWVYNRDGVDQSGYFTYKNTYRYAGHLWPNPTESTQDINFGVCDYYNFPYNTMTNNNLYNRFYKTQMNIFETGHIMTAHFKLSYKDILNIELNERIYVYDSWWNINEIKDFDMNKEGLTKVELITSDPQAELFTPDNDIKIPNDHPNGNNGVINVDSILNPSGNVFGTGVTGVIVGGSGNVIQPGSSNTLVLGKSNNVNGTNNFIQGNNNKVNGDEVTILGADNITIDGNNIIQLGGPNTTINFGATGSSFQSFVISTTDATVTDIALFEAALPVDNVGWYNAYITGVQDDGSTAYFSEVTAGVKNDGGVVTLVDKTDVIEKTEFTTATTDIVISGTDVIAQVTGEAATNINWICNITFRT